MTRLNFDEDLLAQGPNRNNQEKVPKSTHTIDGLPDLGEETTVLGRLPGFHVMQNVWYRSGDFHFWVKEGQSFPHRDHVLTSSSIGYETHPVSDLGKLGIRPVRRLQGTTFIITEALWDVYLKNGFHILAESFFGGLIASAQTLEPGVDSIHAKPNRVIMPVGRTDDATDLRDTVLNAFADAGVYGSEAWAKMTKDKDQWFAFEKVVFIDRWAAHRLHPLIVSWRTVLIPLLSLGLQPGWFRPFQLHLFKALDGPRPLERQRPGKALRDIPKIVYVDRQLAKRALLAIHHDDLQAGLKDLESQGVATVESVRLEEMSPAAQILMVSDADIIVGVHGMGMFHQMWMPPGGKVIEFFRPGLFTREYELIGKFFDHEHRLVWHDRVVPRLEWDIGRRTGDMNDLHDGRCLSIDAKFVVGLVKGVCKDMTTT